MARNIRVRVHEIWADPRDFTLSDQHDEPTERLLETIHSGYGGRQIVQDLTCGADGEIWLVVANIPDPHRGPNARRWSLRHWPGSGVEGSHFVASRSARMSDEHKQWQEYSWRCGDEHPKSSAAKERSLTRGTTRSDVVMYKSDGSPIATVELQVSGEHETNVTRRDNAVSRVGVSPFWFGHTGARPNWAPRVAWLGANRLEHMRPGGWTLATGHRGITWERCSPSSPQPCPFRRSGWCTGVHPMWEPRGGTVDDFIARVLDGDLIRADIGTGIITASPGDVEAWADHFNADPAVVAAQAAERARKLDLNSGKQVLHKPRSRVDESVTPEFTSRRCPTCIHLIWTRNAVQCVHCTEAGKPTPVFRCARCGRLTVTTLEWVCSFCGDAMKAGA